ncbi:CDP-glycerol glycerophosphotransferase family protein [Ruminococcus sp. HUN007]|uniref:CDP-glycerol glycerophosphotransferase family protein n=1 Tax=Ruminococcus sp. HUN007 TaxID=1514668 RepID=UPI0005D2BC14|nr:CDP-glycerol glycerophosphotransferase family protein [Ruminococcus sp. HUN007]
MNLKLFVRRKIRNTENTANAKKKITGAFSQTEKKQLMVYSEQNGFYKYFSGIIDYICEHSDIVIHYVTSDPDDLIFKDEREQIKAYYVASDRYLIPLFMKLDADMCLMTMPDLEKYHIKRSRVRDDVEYVFVCHGIGSITTYRRGALDWFDTVLCPNADQEKEIRAYEKLYGTPEKLLVETGYPLIDQMIREYQNTEHEKHDVPQIIIAPSWQKDNIIDMCLEELLDGLLKSGFQIIVRPHPQQVRHEPERFEMLKTRYNDYGNVEIETDFSKNRNVFESDILITDWSGIAFEYAFVTRKPVVYIDTPMKVMNNDYEQIGIEPLNKTIRTSIGEVIPVEQVSEARQIIEKMIDSKDYYEEKITQELEKHLYNVGRSSEISGRYIIKALKKRI